ncbi:non-homologous end-joining DNA ligase [Guyparkeria sp. 1SP6A2]|nr:non-homologous end-joining DNA ligase [Guyparkeria sp. 1SP6A2]
MTDWRDRLDDEQVDQLETSAMPDWTSPMLATLTDERFSSPDWIYERKLDGERCLAFRDGHGVRLMSRNRKRLDATYPELVDALEQATEQSFIADGEIVAFTDNRTSFSRLQQRIGITDADEARQSDVKVYLYLFDLIYFDDSRLDALALRDRKRILRSELHFQNGLRFTPHRNEEGESAYRKACDKGWEGLIAKRADSPYRHSRSRDWLKFKCVNQQEFVIAGYTDPQGERHGFGALLLGYYENGRLQYAGKVGTGFDASTLETLHRRLASRSRKQTAFDAAPDEADRHTHWVKPELVAEVGFTEWTGDGRLRHPRFLGLRDDKSPQDVHREEPAT